MPKPMEEKLEIVQKLFQKNFKLVVTGPRVETMGVFTLKKLESVVREVRTGRAPGLDGVPTEAILSVLLQQGRFPEL